MVCENCGAVGVFQFSCLPCNGYIDAPSGKVNSLRLQCASALRVETIGSSFKAPPQGEPHAPRSQGEANLHAVLHNAIEILRRRLKTVVPEFASSILALIKTKGSWLHSKRICDDDRIYFKAAADIAVWDRKLISEISFGATEETKSLDWIAWRSVWRHLGRLQGNIFCQRFSWHGGLEKEDPAMMAILGSSEDTQNLTCVRTQIWGLISSRLCVRFVSH